MISSHVSRVDIPAQSILRNAAIPNYLMPIPFQKVTLTRCAYRSASSKGSDQIRFLGGKLGQAIADKFEVSTVGDLL